MFLVLIFPVYNKNQTQMTNCVTQISDIVDESNIQFM